ncbi:LOW QUALITY PROTEIN: integrin alpha-PS2-like [Palaemon carinicauda]|uniref:LOW QUALITY PROTEIN: integrin alpha-PS2-like n=1 Tax=Palaemon carinicauda TaxID=392227 RepID=UPI0035B674A2
MARMRGGSWLLMLFWLLVDYCNAFNIDIGSHVTHFGDQSNSMFGFDVAQYKYGGKSLLLVGAPKYDTEQRNRGVSKAGAVLKCSPEIPNVCEYIPFDRNGNNVHQLGLQLDNKSNQWFGATVSSSGVDGVVVACAPRYVWFSESLKRRDPVGTCYLAREGLTDFQEFSPCRTRHWGYHRQGSCQAGFDAVITDDNSRMFIGAPGAYYWQGQVHSLSLPERNDYKMTYEGPATEDDQYLGYSMAVGDFTGDGLQDVALGVPKGLNYTGKGQPNQRQQQAQPLSLRQLALKRYVGLRNDAANKTEVEDQEDPPLTWQEWFEQSGFLFLPKAHEGYKAVDIWNLTQDSLDETSYGSYSMAVGEFDGLPGQDLVVGIPRGANTKGNLTGKIALYTYNLVPIQNITGYQLGSYFGYCLAVVDFNNDGLDDIVVGAPMYTNYNDQEMKFEVGRVHVILQNQARRFRQVVTFNGNVNRGRFGTSLTKLSDINMDGIDDFAVGAPYGGDDGKGAVFIYHGFEIRSGELVTPEMKKPAQVIQASDLSHRLSTFGWSLSGGLDMDNNVYPDLLIGSYASDAAVLLKARPVVNLFNHSLTFTSEGKTIDIEAVGEDQSGCRTPSGRPVACVGLEFCIGYTGIGVPDDLEMFVEYQLDEKLNEPRLFFLSNENRKLEEQIQLERNITLCKLHQVYVTKTLTDKLTPMSAGVKYRLVEPSYRRAPRSLTPILNQRQKLALSDSITIQKNCGDDNVCIPDLILTFIAPDKYVSDRKKLLEVDIRVVNDAEDAFEARVYVPVPPGLSYTNFLPKDNTSVTCSQRAVGSNLTIVCEIGNPLPMHKGVHFGMTFEQLGDPDGNQFLFEVTANSTNSEESRTRDDNVALRSVLVDADTQIILYGTSDPENIEYNRTLYNVRYKTHEKHLGPQLMHKYGLSNKGPSHIMESEIVILWPTKSLNGNYLLYLVEQPLTEGPVNCSIIPDVNPMNLQLIEKKVDMNVLKPERQEETLRNVELDGQYTEETYVSGGGVYGESDSGSDGASESSSSSSSESSYSSSSSGGSSSSSSSSSTFTRTYSSSSSSSKTSHSSSSDYGYSSSENELVRKRRQAREPIDWEKETSHCGITQCTQIRCRVGLLTAGDIVYVYVRSRLVVDTLENYPIDDVSITSRMVARVKRLPHGVSPTIIPMRSLDVTTPVSPAKSLDEAPPIPWWVIVLATMAGVLILLIIILILWKCGYFKRNRPEASGRGADDAQPLNPPNGHNGHNYSPYNRPFYPGDEAL